MESGLIYDSVAITKKYFGRKPCHQGHSLSSALISRGGAYEDHAYLFVGLEKIVSDGGQSSAIPQGSKFSLSERNF